MKHFVKIILLTALILGIACGIKEYIQTIQPSASVASENDSYAHFHKTINNSLQPWNLVLVNGFNKASFLPPLSLYETENGEKVDKRIYPFLEEMLIDAKTAGFSPEIASGYRTKNQQKQLLDEKIKEFSDRGYSAEEAEKSALRWVALSRYSEHHTGLAVDINSLTDDSSGLYNWLEKNCHKYGFILRYPATATEITGIEYEPWHFRYVGNDAAQYIHNNGITLEEYIFTIQQST